MERTLPSFASSEETNEAEAELKVVHGNMNGEQDRILFGNSEFRNAEKTFAIEFRRWIVQFITLSIKNWKVLKRKPVYVCLFLLLPSCIVLTFLGERSYYQDFQFDENLPSVPIDQMGDCYVHFQSECIRVAYAPTGTEMDNVMKEVSSMQGFSFGTDVQGFSSRKKMKDFVASNLGKVEYTVFFRDEGNSLWTNGVYRKTEAVGSSVSTGISGYVIFYNETLNRRDGRSKMYEMNFQLLALQKSLESAYLKQMYPSKYEQYNLNYGQMWNSSLLLTTEESTAGYTASELAMIETNEKCLLGTIKNMETVGYLLPWVASFSMIFMSVIAYRMLTEERHKNLFGFLRRIGLMDSAYHASWFISFQILQLVACIIAMIVMAGIRSENSYYRPSLALRKIDYGVMYLVLWVGSTCFVCSAFFMSSVSTSLNASNAIIFAQFLAAFLTITACLVPLNTFVADGPTGGNILSFNCFYQTSSWNTIYSTKGLQGAGFVQFLVFFMPWFHLSQALTNLVSVVMYDSDEMKVTLSDNFAEPPTRLSYSAAPGQDYRCGWIKQSLEYMIYSSIIFCLVSWFLYQAFNADGSEGRPVLSILVPPFLRKQFQEQEIIEEGDRRGEERLKSSQEGSVRGYKLSKSYFGGVQALKEVSFVMKKGEVFVLLGHNGAGKSTLINIMTGLTASTRGKTFLNGLDIDEDVSDIQQHIGVCPQDDILWESLTAMDHMLLVAAFKGLSGNNLFSPLFVDASKEEAARDSPLFASIQAVLRQVQLLDRSNDFASSYSGGMRRRLSVALSTVGDVDVVILDEPTTGLDPLSRRRVWETINRLKQDRVVLLTTHNMEEADALGDNIMILHNGQTKAIGDSLALKNLYGQGYQVQMEVRLQYMEDFLDLMKKLLPGSRCSREEEANPGLVTLSVGRGDVSSLPRLFAWLEGSRHSEAFVKEWAISNTTLEQVFLTLCTQNTTVNFVDTSLELERRQLKMCPMCGKRPREAIISKRYTPRGAGAEGDEDGDLIALPDSVCRHCAETNKHYSVTELDASEALADDSGVLMTALVERAQVAYNNEVEQTALDPAYLNVQTPLTAVMTCAADASPAIVGPAQHPAPPSEGSDAGIYEAGAAARVASGDNEIPNGGPLPETGQADSHEQTQNEAFAGSIHAAGAVEMVQQGPGITTVHPLARRGFAVTPIAVTAGDRRKKSSRSYKGDVQRYAVTKYGSRFQGSAGSHKDQMLAIFIKNTRLQAKQRCSNCCSMCYVATMFLFLYVMSLLIQVSLQDLSQCPAGYVSTVGCNLNNLTDHLFYPTLQTVVGEDSTASDMACTNGLDASSNTDGYGIKTYMIPAESSTLATSYRINGVNILGGLPPNAGLPVQLQTRPNILWSSLLSSSSDDLLDTTASTGFGFSVRGPPSSVASGDANAPNKAQYDSQTATNTALKASASSCWYYVGSAYDIGSFGTTKERVVELFGATYSDVAIQCPACSAVSTSASYTSVSSRSIDFEGTLWVGKNMHPGESVNLYSNALDYGYGSVCEDFSCFPYGFGFLNYRDNTLSASTQYLHSESCPTGYGYYSKSPYMEVAQTQVAATYINLLSNSLVDPLLRNYTLQGAYSPYGQLLMDGYVIPSSQSFFLIFFSMVIMNGFWHLGVWRLGHEQSLDLVELMRAMGLRPWVYILSMFTYDFLISLVTGEVMLGFAVGLELLNFKNAPMGLLTAIVVCSAVAFNGATLLIARVSSRVAGVASLVAVCLTLVMAVFCTILNLQLYSVEGKWPIGLSVIPWLAQSRALYIILVYHRSSYEADASLALLFCFGLVCIVVAMLLAERDNVVEYVAEKTNINIDGGADDEDMALLLQEVPRERAAPAVAGAGEGAGDGPGEAKIRQQLDVAEERERARKYIIDLLREGGEGLADDVTRPNNDATVAVTAAGAANNLVEEGAAGSDGGPSERLVTVIFNMRHKYVEESVAGLVSQLLWSRKRVGVEAGAGVKANGEAEEDIHSEAATTTEDTFDAIPASAVRPSEGNRGGGGAEIDSDKWAVRGLSLALSLGECFGLLGPNGAGKSTTISVLIGKIKATLGKQFVAGVDLKHGLSSVHQFIGICPQFDVTWPDLSVEEHLAFQARQRGIPASKIKAKVQQAAQWVHLDGDAFNTKAAGLSGGMRRRLTIAMALIGDPPIILMDEPTTGLDPENRQQVWKIIHALRGPDRLILLTTHSMEEAEALCSRIGIMAQGTLRCIGSSQHLKAQFGKGFTLTVNSLSKEPEALAMIDEYVVETMARGKASVLSRVNCTTRYLINKEEGGVGVSQIFKRIEAKKAALGIREWGLAMTTLEEVFVSAVSEE